MKNSTQFKLAAMAATVAAAFSGAAYGQTTPINGAGASAINGTLKNIVLLDYCNNAGATDIKVWDNGTQTTGAGNGGVYRITCTPTAGAAKFSGGVDISYDTTGGSWKGLISTNSALFTAAQSTRNANPVLTIDTGSAGCTASAAGNTFTVGTTAVPVTLEYGCATSTLASATSVTFGFTDVDESLFNQSTYNQPLSNGTWNTSPQQIYGSNTKVSSGTPWAAGTAEGNGAPYGGFGVVFGIGASQSLYNAMQLDQWSAGTLPSTCVTTDSTGAFVYTAWAAGGNACTPNITRSQYRSIIGSTATTGAGSVGNALLFTTVIPVDATLELARRDQGSGSQASSNAYFADVGCTGNTDLVPALPILVSTNLKVTYNATTGSVINELKSPTAAGLGTSKFAIGVVSAENDSAAKLGTATFLKLDGVYPSNTNAYNGSYGYVTTENFHCASGATGDPATLCLDLTGSNGTAGVPASDTLAGYTGTGIVQFTNASNHYTNNNHVCAGWRHL